MASNKTRVLLLTRKTIDPKFVTYETILRGLLRVPEGVRVPECFRGFKVGRVLDEILCEDAYSRQSYIKDWADAFIGCPEVDVVECDTMNLIDFKRRIKDTSFDLIVVMHSALGDDADLMLDKASWFHRRKGVLAVFVGNEYDIMDKKFAFLRESCADYVCSQLPHDTAQWLYGHIPGLKVLNFPHALNPDVFCSDGIGERSTWVGFRGDFYANFIGDSERNDFIRYFMDNEDVLGLSCDIQRVKVDRYEWAAFLKSCKTIVGAESGLLYLDREGELVKRAKEYCVRHPDATVQEVREQCYENADIEYRSGRCISSRHFEPVGTRTCQLLLEGRYNDILLPGEHYIEVKRDFSNINEAVDQLKDDAVRERIVESAYEFVMENHTYAKRVEQLLKVVFE